MVSSYTLLSLDDDSSRNETRRDNTSRLFRGGFLSSICSAPTTSPSDCCALACCGLLLEDRNMYLLSQEEEEEAAPWWKRLSLNIGLPLLTLVIFGELAESSTSPDEQAMYQETGVAVFATLVLLLLLRGWYYRFHQRRRVLRRIQAHEREQRITSTTQPTGTIQEEHCCETLCATSVCGFYPADVSMDIEDEEGDNADLGTCLWTFLRSPCCGLPCRCWCQCCGMCAVAQHNRQILVVEQQSSSPPQMDYITFEPYVHYTPKLQELRVEQIMSFWRHLQALSLLSKKLLHLLASFIVGLAIVAILRVERNFTLVNLLVVVATFLQASIILYFVHWRWHRFDLSLDAVIKYFSSGFLLSTGMAVVLEVVLSVILSLIQNVVVLVIVFIELSGNEDIPMDRDSKAFQTFVKDFSKNHLWLFVIFVFFNAYLVAALTEELSKYFGYFVVEHDDLAVGGGRDRVSIGAGITVAMVTTALGFACCENLLYVFVYTPPSLANEVATLLARSLFPVHPLAAAIQSIGVCRRDLEKDKKWRLGRIVLPAVLLHGSFDFSLMVMALFQQPLSDDDDEEEDGDDNIPGIQDELPALITSVTICFVGLLYYFCQADAQRIRLEALDQADGNHRRAEDSPLLV